MQIEYPTLKPLKSDKSRTIPRVLAVVLISSLLTGCVWWRLYQTKQQLNDFDQYFALEITENFTWHFKQPLVYSDDFIYLAKFHPSFIENRPHGQRWRYRFHKVDNNKQKVLPEVKYFFELTFNEHQRLTAWMLSSLFLKMAPPDFLEVSLRSLGRGKINEGKRQLKVDAASMQQTSAVLPKKSAVLRQLGEPLETVRKDELDVYHYHFMLETEEIEEGYEDRALTEVKLSFDENNDLVKLAGRFVGVKLKIDYRKYRQDATDKTG